MPPFDITRAYNIYARTLERCTLLVMAKAHRTRTILLAVLSKSQMMERRLTKAKIEHVGKHIPTTASN
jgi:hypothetical protein